MGTQMAPFCHVTSASIDESIVFAANINSVSLTVHYVDILLSV